MQFRDGTTLELHFHVALLNYRLEFAALLFQGFPLLIPLASQGRGRKTFMDSVLAVAKRTEEEKGCFEGKGRPRVIEDYIQWKTERFYNFIRKVPWWWLEGRVRREEDLPKRFQKVLWFTSLSPLPLIEIILNYTHYTLYSQFLDEEEWSAFDNKELLLKPPPFALLQKLRHPTSSVLKLEDDRTHYSRAIFR